MHESLEDDGKAVAACGEGLVRSSVSSHTSYRPYLPCSRDILYELTSMGELPLPQPSPPADTGREPEPDTPLFTSSSDSSWNQNKILGNIPNEPPQMQRSPKQQKSTFTMSPNAGSPKFSLPVYSNELGRLPLQSFDAQARNSQPHRRENHWHVMPHSVRAEGGDRFEPTPFTDPKEASSSYDLRHSGTSVPPLQQQQHPPRSHHALQSIPTHGFSSTSMEQSPYGVDPSEMAPSMSFESMMETLSHTQSRTSMGSNSMVAPLSSNGGSSMENVYSGITEGSDPMFAPRHSTYLQQQEVPRQGELFYPFSVDNDMAAIWSKAPTGFECVILVLFRRCSPHLTFRRLDKWGAYITEMQDGHRHPSG